MSLPRICMGLRRVWLELPQSSLFWLIVEMLVTAIERRKQRGRVETHALHNSVASAARFLAQGEGAAGGFFCTPREAARERLKSVGSSRQWAGHHSTTGRRHSVPTPNCLAHQPGQRRTNASRRPPCTSFHTRRRPRCGALDACTVAVPRSSFL